MNILVILGHPNKTSFNHALAQACIAQLAINGHTIFFHDLYNEQFNAVDQQLPSNTTPNDAEIMEQHISDLRNSDGIIIVHPNWWGQPPAIVKGWIDRVLQQDVAYTFTSTPNGQHVPMGLLKAKSALVLNTSNTPNEVEENVYKNPLETLWKKRVFEFCGVMQFKRKNFSIVKDSTDAIRTTWIEEARQLINACFPPAIPT